MTKTAIDLARELIALSKELPVQSEWMRGDVDDESNPYLDIYALDSDDSDDRVCIVSPEFGFNWPEDGDFCVAARNHAPAIASALLSVQERLEKAEELLEVHFKKLWEDDLNIENVCGATLAFCGRCEEDGGSILARAATWKDVPHSEKCIYAPARAFLTEQSQ